MTSPHLKSLARRLFQVLANSMSSKKFFFTMNFIHNKMRNLLISQRVNKLQYIYINERTLKKQVEMLITKAKLLNLINTWIMKQQNIILTDLIVSKNEKKTNTSKKRHLNENEDKFLQNKFQKSQWKHSNDMKKLYDS